MTEVRGQISGVSKSEEKKFMSKKVIRLALSAVLFALCFPAEAQQPTKVPRIGRLGGGSLSSSRIDAFRRLCASLDTWRGKTLSLSGDLLRKNSIASPRSRPS
jgi:hypothetical protein